MKRRWKLYSRVIRELIAEGKNDRIAAALALEGYRRPPGGDRVHDDIVTLIKTERGLEGASLHPEKCLRLREILGLSLKEVWRRFQGPQVRSAALDAVASAENVEPEEEINLPKDYDRAVTLRAKIIADTAEKLGDEVILVGYSTHIARELLDRGILIQIVDEDPRLRVERNIKFCESVLLSTGMVLSNGSLRRFLASHKGPVMLYSQSCPHLAAVLTRQGVVDAAVVEEFPYHFSPGGECKLRVYEPENSTR
ncbi:hypothetical protein [Methanopyrus sp.]